MSYGLYLWHWPLYVVISHERTGLVGVPLLAVRLAATFATATASFYLVERPIRRGRLHRWPARVTAPATAGLLALALVATTGGGVAPLSQTAAADLRPPPTAPAAPAGETGPVRVMVVGDSVANSMGPGLERAAASNGLTVWNASVDGCGITQDVGERRVWGWETANPECSPGWRQRWPLQLSQFNPDVVVVLLGTDDTFDRRIDGQEIMFDSPEGDDLTRNELQEAITLLSGSGAHVVLLTTPYNVIGWPRRVRLDRSTYNPAWVDRWNESLRAVATRNPATATIVDLNRFLDPEGKWSDTIDGVKVHTDDKMHLSPEGADLVANWLAPQVFRLARAPVPTANASVGAPIGVAAG